MSNVRNVIVNMSTVGVGRDSVQGRFWRAQILDVIHHVLLLKRCSDLYEVMRHKNATCRHLQLYSCHLLRRVAVPLSAVSDISNPWSVAFYLWDTHVMSAGSIGVKALTRRHLKCYSYCRLVNLLNRIVVNLPVICGVGQFELCWKGDKSHKSDLGAVRIRFTNCSAYASKFSWSHIFRRCLFYLLLI